MQIRLFIVLLVLLISASSTFAELIGDYRAPDEINVETASRDSVTDHVLTRKFSSFWEPDSEDEYYCDGILIDEQEALQLLADNPHSEPFEKKALRYKAIGYSLAMLGGITGGYTLATYTHGEKSKETTKRNIHIGVSITAFVAGLYYAYKFGVYREKAFEAFH